MNINKYPFFKNTKNPFNKNEKEPTVIFKKGFVMFDENGEGYRPVTSIPIPITYLLLNEADDALLDENGNNLEIQY